MSSASKTKVAVIGSGNIGTDLMIKMSNLSDQLEVVAMVGIDPGSGGLDQAKRIGVPTTADGVAGLIAMADFDQIAIVFDATSAKAHAWTHRSPVWVRVPATPLSRPSSPSPTCRGGRIAATCSRCRTPPTISSGRYRNDQSGSTERP